MIMDGLDTLSQVALADQLNLSFDVYNPPASSATDAVAGPSPIQSASDSFPLPRGLLLDDVNTDNLNTPVTTSSDVNFNFVSSDLEFSQEAFPITATIEASVSIPERTCQSTVYPGLPFASDSLSSTAGGMETTRIHYHGTFTTKPAVTSSAPGVNASQLLSPLLSILTQGGLTPAQLSQAGSLSVLSDSQDFTDAEALFGSAHDLAQDIADVTSPMQPLSVSREQSPAPISTPATPQDMAAPLSAGPSPQQQSFECSRQPTPLSPSESPSPAQPQQQQPLQMPFSTSCSSTHSTPEPQPAFSPMEQAYSPMEQAYSPPSYAATTAGRQMAMKQPPTYSSCSLQQPIEVSPCNMGTSTFGTSTSTTSEPSFTLPPSVQVSEVLTFSKSSSCWPVQSSEVPDFSVLQQAQQPIIKEEPIDTYGMPSSSSVGGPFVQPSTSGLAFPQPQQPMKLLPVKPRKYPNRPS